MTCIFNNLDLIQRNYMSYSKIIYSKKRKSIRKGKEKKGEVREQKGIPQTVEQANLPA